VSLRRARRSGDPIAAANLPALTRDWPFVSVMAGGGHGAGASRPSLNGCSAAPKRGGGCAALGPGLGPKITDRTGTPTAKGICAQRDCPEREWKRAMPQKEMGAGIAASPHCAERRICRCSWAWSKTRRLRPDLDPGSPAQASFPIRQLPRERSRTDLPDCAARGFAGHSVHPACSKSRSENRNLAPKPPDVPRPFLGQSLPCPALLTEIPKNSGNRVARQEDCLFRRLIPTDPEKNPKALPTACRRRSDLWSPAAPSCRCRLSGEAGTAVPITQAPCTPRPSRKSEKCGGKPVDNGDIGHNRRNLFKRRGILGPGCRSVPLRLLAPSA
jgi:hypothetical protein